MSSGSVFVIGKLAFLQAQIKRTGSAIEAGYPINIGNFKIKHNGMSYNITRSLLTSDNAMIYAWSSNVTAIRPWDLPNGALLNIRGIALLV